MEAGRSMLARETGTCGSAVDKWNNRFVAYRLSGLGSHHYENAFLWRQLQWAVSSLVSGSVDRGDVIVPVARRNRLFWRMNRCDNMLMMSSFHLSEKNAPMYIRALEEFDPVLSGVSVVIAFGAISLSLGEEGMGAVPQVGGDYVGNAGRGPTKSYRSDNGVSRIRLVRIRYERVACDRDL